jgi:hypothetical protein
LRNDERSILSLYRALIALRANDAFSLGTQRVIGAEGNVLRFVRAHSERFLVALNFGAESHALPELGDGRMVLSTHLDGGADDRVLRGGEGVVLKLS